MKIEFTELKRIFDDHRSEYEDAALRALNSGWYILGPELEAFEKEFAQHMGVKHCIGVNSGTDALILAVRALGIGKGDEVIVPASTYIASVISIIENEAVPVFVDSDEFLLMDTSQLESHITSKTKAILPVHLYGQVCNMDAVTAVAKKYDLAVIEDCAQCHDAEFNGAKGGTQGTIGCFSFYPTKPLGAFGDAGALITNDDDIAEKLRLLRNYGSKVKYHNEINGVNSRLDEVQAAVLRTGLKYLEAGNNERRRIADRYFNEIKNPAVSMPLIREGCTHVFHQFPIMVEDRDGFRSYLEEKGVNTQIHYPIPPYVAECYKDLGYSWDDFPKASYISKHEVSLPIYVGLKDEEIDYIIDIVNSY